MRLLARASAGLLLWAFGFALLYGLHGIGCARGWDAIPLLRGTLFGWTMVATWILLTAGAVAILAWVRRGSSGLERHVAIASALAGLAGIIVTGSPVVLTSACL
jgi:hypothetical protein